MSIFKQYPRRVRHRYVLDGRLAWYDQPADEQYWYDYWKARLKANYYVAAEARPVANDELGNVLLKEMCPGGLHIEAGCGVGYWVAALRRQGFMIEGIEYAQELVDLVHSVYPQLPVRWGNALNIDSHDSHYDSYLSFGVVEHRIEGPEPFLAEAYRVLKPGGKIIISVPYFGPIRMVKSWLSLYDKERPDLPFFQYGFSKREFMGYLQKAGFSVDLIRALYVDRLLLEELILYRWLAFQSCGRWVKRVMETLLQNKDGHMLLMVGRKAGI